MIDHQSKQVIDLLPSRTQENVAHWLTSFPNLTFVIRDGSQAFRCAIAEACPDAIQIADRFHVLKSLTEHALTAIRPLIPKEITNMKALDKGDTPLLQVVKKLSDSQLRKQELVKLVRAKRSEGWKYTEIARHFELDPRTVKRYCDRQISILDKYQKRESRTGLDDYKDLLVKLMGDYQTLQPVFESLIVAGYDRTFETFRKTYKQVLKKRSGQSLFEIKVHKKPITKLLFERKVNWDTLSYTTKTVLKEGTELLNIIHFVLEFRNILEDVSLESLDDWINRIRKSGNKELIAFTNGLERDKDAIQNAMIFPELSNGLAEGKINKLKNIKRIMFGRCSFQMLRLKMILSER